MQRNVMGPKAHLFLDNASTVGAHKEFKKIADTGKGMIVMSFGSIARAELMPGHWKSALLNAFARFPNYEFLESINSGVPLVTIALFGDQFKNSRMAAKHGFAVNIKKGTLNEANVAAALKEVLTNKK
ncbi:hypothetical protein OESDEN_08904 [Oesophagostomum dentatum]|uniref:glucuronosyltransferase n=1 Tax=Oesophagostomum dentatum TaxID=61180 RepID=A0A0B1T530_OESDE|nr:hypothetical protein OESDEN_08904 [Oesophagostomum dentatum]